MDIKSGYNLDLLADRNKCWESIIRGEPLLVIGSPPCTMFSRFQELNKHMYRDNDVWMEKFQLGMEQAKRYVRFCTQVYEHQRKHGRFFLHEHPWLATSWTLDVIERLVAHDDVQRVQTHMCQFGMTSRIGGVGSELGPVLKPTGFMTNSPCIARELARLCPRDHVHVPLVGGRAAGAAIYPEKLCCHLQRVGQPEARDEDEDDTDIANDSQSAIVPEPSLLRSNRRLPTGYRHEWQVLTWQHPDRDRRQRELHREVPEDQTCWGHESDW